MGNCICVINKTTTERRRRRGSTVFHDDDVVEEKLLGETSNVSSSSSSSTCGGREIKIKMTRKEFEDLMRNISLEGLTAEEVFSNFLSDGGDQTGTAADQSNDHQRPWRPALQSIPEID
ncbi:hypothetical protein BRARA_C04585 [Brassica rapa]|uniref:Uncharacterized protein n=3 Tax=Brassica TaxID=3705 RepID=A0A398ABS1_BRACM|nr:uncharacterized protein LOC106420982 [Brassica napus]XP_033142759.1 uncharacterized protein LOC103848695 [Brassica rapa]XP_048620285.1 uncharacterized protein LOC125590658 [Brassica napus]XP_048626944.1 uncharacterized protein LOC125594993 [Brassica napus]KAF3485644.1 hypothetical protein F2Q69_00057180 [Brassica cretica]KAH0853378.1 hypothetical protein HID58_093249 [Brassica napus]KAH0854316.1 hypothetical protein HID58_078981 [Brassica napus]RID72706.1 hypothetical protein BRARA_C04585